MSRILLLIVAAVGLLGLSTGCYVHASVNSRHGHSHPHTSYSRPHSSSHGHSHGHSYGRSSSGSGWVYYPEHDIYYSSNAGHWCYHDGGRWVVVTSRPNWFRASGSSTVRIEYSGSRPFDHWHNHRTRWGSSYHRTHNAPRRWGTTTRTHEHDHHEYRYTERRRY